MKEDAILRSALSDILRGFSVFKVNGKSVYSKHLGLEDSVDYEEVYDEYYNKLKRKGVESEKELLDKFTKNGLWSEEKDSEIKRLKEDIESQKETIDKTFVKEQRVELEKYLKDLEDKYNKIFNIKWGFIRESREILTNKKVNEYYIVNSLYKDGSFSEKFVSEDEKEDADFDFKPFFKGYESIIKKCSIENIKKISIASFFRDFWDLSDANIAYYYFGKPICKLTYNQTTLSNYALIFGNIFKNYPEIKADDPDKIMQLAKQRSEAEKRKANSKSKNSPAYIGMSSDEYESMGMQRPGKEKLFEEALKKGGKLRVK